MCQALIYGQQRVAQSTKIWQLSGANPHGHVSYTSEDFLLKDHCIPYRIVKQIL